jgi:transposase
MFYLLNYKSEMKENPILCRIKILKAIFGEKISNRKLSRKINIHYNTIWNIKKIFNSKSNI